VNHNEFSCRMTKSKSKKSKQCIETVEYEIEQILGLFFFPRPPASLLGRLFPSSSSQTLPSTGHRWSRNQLQFFVKWKGWDHKDNTWSPYENLLNSVVFREYLNRYYFSLEDDILAAAWKIREDLKEAISVQFNQPRFLTMNKVLPFDPLELKVYQVFHHDYQSDNDAFSKKLVDLTFRSVFFNLYQRQQHKIDDLLAELSANGFENVTVENIEDFSFPKEFQVISKNIVVEVTRAERFDAGSKGCKCTECSTSSVCCPQSSKLPFPYKVDNAGRTLLKLPKTNRIIECGELCSCPESCKNRLTQQQKQVPLCLFKTCDRGWGLKAGENIPRGGFVMEFVGELISSEEAENRERAVFTYDLNTGCNDYATIDATCCGNLSRFTNHSCEANTATRIVSDCSDDPKKRRLW
jgi:[histone H3]-lysine9 N-trimethyltransferase SUV39H